MRDMVLAVVFVALIMTGGALAAGFILRQPTFTHDSGAAFPGSPIR